MRPDVETLRIHAARIILRFGGWDAQPHRKSSPAFALCYRLLLCDLPRLHSFGGSSEDRRIDAVKKEDGNEMRWLGESGLLG